MEEFEMLKLLDRLIWLIDRNRFVEARNLVKIELENINGITEVKCRIKGKNRCSICNNYHCSLNTNKKIVKKDNIIDILQEVLNIIENDNINQAITLTTTYINKHEIMQNELLFIILRRIKLFLELQDLIGVKKYIELELTNLKRIKPNECRKLDRNALHYYCNDCNNYTCNYNKNYEVNN